MRAPIHTHAAITPARIYAQIRGASSFFVQKTREKWFENLVQRKIYSPLAYNTRIEICSQTNNDRKKNQKEKKKNTNTHIHVRARSPIHVLHVGEYSFVYYLIQ